MHRFLVKPPIGTPVNHSQRLGSSLLYSFLLNESGNGNVPAVFDNVSHIVGTPSGDITWVPGGVAIGSSQDRIVAPVALNNTSHPYGSVDCIFKPTWAYDDGVNHYLWDSNGRRFLCDKRVDNSIEFFFDDSKKYETAYAFQANTYYHLVITWPSVNFYVDGKYVGTGTDSGLGTGITSMYLGDRNSLTNISLSGDLIYFAIRTGFEPTVADVASLYANPYQVYGPEIPVWYNLSLADETLSISYPAAAASAGDIDLASAMTFSYPSATASAGTLSLVSSSGRGGMMIEIELGL